MLCTGNICRSPMAEAFLRQRLTDLGVDARVSSAGLLGDGAPASDFGRAVLADAYGLDTTTHVSRRVQREMLADADLVLGMAREHVREAVLLHPPCWPRTFTLKELVRRGREIGPRFPAETFGQWLAHAHEGRSRAQLLGSSEDDDVADPIGQARGMYERTAAEIDELVRELVRLGWAAAVREDAHDRP